MAADFDVMFSAETLARRITEMGQAIARDYQGRELVLVSVLKGSFIFCADLARAIDLPIAIEFLGLKSYGDAQVSSGVVQITSDLTRPIAGKDVLIVKDIVDTGLTLDYLQKNLATRGPNSVKVCALLHKPARTRVHVDIAYLGFSIEDAFVVGYGLDWAERYRNLPFVGVVRQSPTGAKVES